MDASFNKCFGGRERERERERELGWLEQEDFGGVGVGDVVHFRYPTGGPANRTGSTARQLCCECRQMKTYRLYNKASFKK